MEETDAVAGICGLGRLGTGDVLAQYGTAWSQPQGVALSGHVRSARRKARWKACWSARIATGRTSPSPSSATPAGQYAFPGARLAPGHYALTIRAVGYDLAAPAAVERLGRGPGDRRSDVAQDHRSGGATDQRRVVGQPARRTRAEAIPAELRRLPHAASAAVLAATRPDEFVTVQERMAHYSAASSLLLPQRSARRSGRQPGRVRAGEAARRRSGKQAEYLASVR